MPIVELNCQNSARVLVFTMQRKHLCTWYSILPAVPMQMILVYRERLYSGLYHISMHSLCCQNSAINCWVDNVQETIQAAALWGVAYGGCMMKELSI